jgi:hypothetical protein
MRVNNRNLTGATPAESGRAQKTGKVELSSALETLSRAISTFGSERCNRVQTHAAQYRSGSYHPDSAAVARGIVSDALLGDGLRNTSP